MTLPNRTPDGYESKVNLSGKAKDSTDEDGNPAEGASKREYLAYEITAELQGDDEHFFRYDPVGLTKLTLYVDSETGLVTADVEKFESWLKAATFTK